jgi:hypothetical protein
MHRVSYYLRDRMQGDIVILQLNFEITSAFLMKYIFIIFQYLVKTRDNLILIAIYETK